MSDVGFNENGRTLVADGMVCIPIQRLDDLAQTEQRYQIAVRGIRQMMAKRYTAQEDAGLLLELLGEDMPQAQEGKEEEAHVQEDELPYV